MKKRILALIAGTAAMLATSAAMETAEARRGHGGGHAHFRSYSVPHSHRGIYYAPMYPRQFHRNYFYAGPRYIPDSCAALRHRAHATGSRYWWQQYRACRSGYHYY